MKKLLFSFLATALSFCVVAQQAGTLTPAQIFANNADAVFTIYASIDSDSFDVVGSGFFISANGVGVTNLHVVHHWQYLEIRTHSGERFDIRGFYSYDTINDLAVIQINGEKFSYLTIGDSETLVVGENVFAIGSPRGYHNTFSTGIISRLDVDNVSVFDMFRIYGMLQTTVPISAGSSGGALLNDRGQVIGITTAGYSGTHAQALNFAIPVSRINTDIPTEYNPLPVGGPINLNDVFGIWIWDGGHYTFNLDSAGNRGWDGDFIELNWRIAGPVLILSDDEDEERWRIRVVNENELNVGGAVLARESEKADTLVGFWHWSGGWYAFNANRTGSRAWSATFNHFTWGVLDSIILIFIENGELEEYRIIVRDSNTVTIAGSLFTRQNPCNTNTPGWGNNLGRISFATAQTWTIDNQVWSDAVTARNCQRRTRFDSGTHDFNADCRSNPNFPGDLFSWCAIYRFGDLLCPYPWRVPTREDFRNLDIALGGIGNNREPESSDIATPQFVTDNHINRWGGAFGGGNRSDGALWGQGSFGVYWSQTMSDVADAFGFSFSIDGLIYTESGTHKGAGRVVRCVR